MNPDNDVAARKAQLIAQCDLDRMRLTHALLVTRHSVSVRSLAGRAFGFALPLFVRARHSGFLRFASIALTVIRALRGFLRR